MITVRIRFEKTGEAAYISLLDLQRVFHRILKRSGLPVYYTQGFNPHIYLSCCRTCCNDNKIYCKHNRYSTKYYKATKLCTSCNLI